MQFFKAKLNLEQIVELLSYAFLVAGTLWEESNILQKLVLVSTSSSFNKFSLEYVDIELLFLLGENSPSFEM